MRTKTVKTVSIGCNLTYYQIPSPEWHIGQILDYYWTYYEMRTNDVTLTPLALDWTRTWTKDHNWDSFNYFHFFYFISSHCILDFYFDFIYIYLYVYIITYTSTFLHIIHISSTSFQLFIIVTPIEHSILTNPSRKPQLYYRITKTYRTI